MRRLLIYARAPRARRLIVSRAEPSQSFTCQMAIPRRRVVDVQHERESGGCCSHVFLVAARVAIHGGQEDRSQSARRSLLIRRFGKNEYNARSCECSAGKCRCWCRSVGVTGGGGRRARRRR